ncbi:hypothetical protein SALBM135S_00418 [Streptomyces alboniger]
MGYSVGQVAGFAGVTVRTLHHYDEIGLLAPGGRSRAGHRRYSDADLDRLQQILFYRELGFPLDQVAALLDDPDADPRAHLRRRHELLTARIARLQEMAAAVETAMEARKMGINLTPEEKFEVFGDHDPEQYADEVERRWGCTEAYRESRRRSASYTKDDWQRINDEFAAVHARVGDLLAQGFPAAPRRWTAPRSTASSSPATTTSARTRHTPASARCTWATSGSPPSTRPSGPGSRRTCGTRSWRTRRATADTARGGGCIAEGLPGLSTGRVRKGTVEPGRAARRL